MSAGLKELWRGCPHKRFLNNPHNLSPREKVSLNCLPHNYIYLALPKPASQIPTILCPPFPLALLPGGGKIHTARKHPIPSASFPLSASVSPNLRCRGCRAVGVNDKSHLELRLCFCFLYTVFISKSN